MLLKYVIYDMFLLYLNMDYMHEKNIQGGTCNSHKLKLKGSRRTEKSKTASAAPSSKPVYFPSAVSNAVYRYHREKNAESKQTIQ